MDNIINLYPEVDTLLFNLDNMRFGFELETQSVNGCDVDELLKDSHDSEITQDSLDRCQREFETYWNDEIYTYSRWLFNNNYNSTLKNSIIEYIYDRQLEEADDDETIERVRRHEEIDRYTLEYNITLQELVNCNYIEESYVDRLQIECQKDFESNYEYDFRDEEIEPEDWAHNTFGYNSNLTAEHDGSISCIEIQTDKGLTYQEFIEAFKTINKTISFEVDKECSFHIHLSVNNRKHYYGNTLQYLMMRYVLSKIDTMPNCLIERLSNSSWRNSYFSFHTDKLEDRYAAIAFRNYNDKPRWEFRLFGSISTEKDAKYCLDLAIEAYQYAYALVKPYANYLKEYDLELDYSMMHDIVLIKAFLKKQSIPLPDIYSSPEIKETVKQVVNGSMNTTAYYENINAITSSHQIPSHPSLINWRNSFGNSQILSDQTVDMNGQPIRGETIESAINSVIQG